MHVAAFYDSLETFLFLFNRGFSVEVMSANGFQPIHYAALGAATEIAGFLCHHKSPSIHNSPGDTGMSPVYLATVARSPDIIRYLSDAGAVIDELKVRNRAFSPIQCAIDNKDTECLTILLERGFSSRQILLKDFSPLMRATSNLLVDAVKLLLRNGADPNYATWQGKNAMQLACMKNSLEIVELLLEHGYDVTRTGFEGVSLSFTRDQFIGLQVRRISKYSKFFLMQEPIPQ